MKHPWLGDIMFQRNSVHIIIAYINNLGKENENVTKTVYNGHVTKLKS